MGETFALYVAEAMAWPFERARFFVGEHPVYHGEIRLSREEHLAWASGPAPTAEHTEVWMARAEERRAKHRFPKVQLGG